MTDLLAQLQAEVARLEVILADARARLAAVATLVRQAESAADAQGVFLPGGDDPNALPLPGRVSR